MDSDWKLKDHLPLDGPGETFQMPNQISCSHRHAGDYMEIEDFGELLRLHKQKRLLSQDYENRVGLFSVERHEVDSRLVKASNSIGLDRSRGTRPTLHSTCFRWQMLQQTGCCLQGGFTWIFIVTLKKDDHKKNVWRRNSSSKIMEMTKLLHIDVEPLHSGDFWFRSADTMNTYRMVNSVQLQCCLS